MQIIIHKCDGCKIEIPTADLPKCRKFAETFVLAFPQYARIPEEIFCETCGAHSGEFWSQKAKLAEEIQKSIEGRFKNFTKQFWGPRMTLVKPKNATVRTA